MKREHLFADENTLQSLTDISEAFGDEAQAVAEELIRCCNELPTGEKRVYESPMRLARPLVERLLATRSDRDRSSAGRAIVAAAAMQLPSTLGTLFLPSSVQALLPAAVGRLAGSLIKKTESVYDESSDLYRKDLRFVVGQTVPCGAQDVDLYSSAPWSTLIKNPSLPKLGRYLSAGGTGAWFRIHTDPRNTEDFNEGGWRRCYQRIAELLEAYPAVRGMVGTSWFYDPQLLDISPRLAYLQTDPLSGGAFMLRNGPGAIHTERATLTSPSRRKLFEEGKYIPICWTVLWPRKELIAWAATQPPLPA